MDGNKIKLRSCWLTFKPFEGTLDKDGKTFVPKAKDEGTSIFQSAISRVSFVGKELKTKDFFYRVQYKKPNTKDDEYDEDEIATLNSILSKEDNVTDIYTTNERQIQMHLGLTEKLHDLKKLIQATKSPVLEMKQKIMITIYSILIQE